MSLLSIIIVILIVVTVLIVYGALVVSSRQDQIEQRSREKNKLDKTSEELSGVDKFNDPEESSAPNRK